ncbi:MAG: prephenate dehydrogenase/arogenate dehydrogenase family protein [Clostridia bacterium]|nr:prephenate dehydrogenase/arogenate dehydrogenase family protein [Clostridia bacterium]
MKIGVVGLGLMGGSFARAAIKKGNEVLGFDVSESVMLKADMMKAISGVLDDNSVKQIDLLIIATTPDKVKGVLDRFVPHLKRGAIVTDFCGIKVPIIAQMKTFAEKYPDIIFVGGHPMAGREFSGIEHSSINLFDNASMVLVNVNADIFTLEKIKNFWLDFGFKNVELCSAEIHDERIAFTSQLCHVVSNAFVKNKNAEVHDGFSAGSYRDLTRVARLNPEMWGNLMTENSENLVNELDQLIGHLTEYRDALKNKDKQLLTKLLADGNERKLSIDCGLKKD